MNKAQVDAKKTLNFYPKIRHNVQDVTCQYRLVYEESSDAYVLLHELCEYLDEQHRFFYSNYVHPNEQDAFKFKLNK